MLANGIINYKGVLKRPASRISKINYMVLRLDIELPPSGIPEDSSIAKERWSPLQ
jgi:hypothetical protein